MYFNKTINFREFFLIFILYFLNSTIALLFLYGLMTFNHSIHSLSSVIIHAGFRIWNIESRCMQGILAYSIFIYEIYLIE